MKIKEILNLSEEELEIMMSQKEFDRMIELNLDIYKLLELLQDGARLSGQEDDEDYGTISEYLDYLEEFFIKD